MGNLSKFEVNFDAYQFVNGYMHKMPACHSELQEEGETGIST